MRFSLTGNPNFSESRKTTFTGDLNSVQCSGLILTEFGLFNVSGPVVSFSAPGSTWSREQIIGSIVCDGTIELRFESSVEVL